MLRSWLTLTFAILALGLPAASRAAVTVFQNPSNLPTPAGPVTIIAGGADVTLHLFYQTDGAATPGCPGGGCTACLSGTGGEVCGWDIHISATNPSITLETFTPEPEAVPGFGIVSAISGNVLRANGGIPTTGELGVRRIGALVVSAAPGASGSVTVSGNLYASSNLSALAVTSGNTLGTVGTDPDLDLDGVLDLTDNCPSVANGVAEAAIVGVGNQIDGTVAWVGGQPLESAAPVGVDGVGDACDNCLTRNNPRVAANFLTVTAPWATLTGGQRDDDHDGYGNQCDGKFPNVGTNHSLGDAGQINASLGENRTGDTCGTTNTRPCAIFDLDVTSTNIGLGDTGRFYQMLGAPRGPRCPTCGPWGTATTAPTDGPLPCASGTAGTCGVVP